MLCALLLSAGAGPLAAQGSLDADAGARIRVRPRGERSWKTGELTGIRPDTIDMRLCLNTRGEVVPADKPEATCGSHSYALRNLDVVEVSQGRQHSAGRVAKGLLIGGMVGFAASTLYVVNSMRQCPRSDDMCGVVAIIIPPATVAGLVTGLMIGAGTTGETWQRARYR